MNNIKNLIRKLILISFFILGFSHLAQALPGDLDLTFGGVGWVTTDFNRTFDEIRALAIQGDGKIVAAGRAGDNFGLARYNFNGSLDSTFGDNGKITTNFGGSLNEMFDMALQPNGRIVVAGRFDDLSYNVDFIVARYNSNGTLDTTFGSNGKVLTDFSGSNTSNEIASAVAIQTNGKIVVAGSSNVSDSDDFALARYNSDGTLDPTFGNEGIVTTDFNNGSIEGIEAIAIQADGKIVAAGDISPGDFALARYNSDGSLDTTFGGSGKVITDFGSSSDAALDIAIQTDGKIVTVGHTVPLGQVDFVIARYSSDGSLDPTFGIGGKVITNFDTNSDDSTFREDFAKALAIQEDGKIVVAGFTSITIIDGDTVTGGDNDFALARYSPNGSLDGTFGRGGKVITNFGLNRFGDRSNDYAFAVAIQKNNGKIVVGGNSNINPTDFAVARYYALQ